MPANKRIHSSWYLLSDYVAAVLAWITLYFVRRFLLKEAITVEHTVYLNDRFWWGVALFPIAWVMLYALVGSYHSLYRKSRLNEFTVTLICTLIGCTVFFFLIVINDPQTKYTYYYKAFFYFVTAQFLFTWIGRTLVLGRIKNNWQAGKCGLMPFW